MPLFGVPEALLSDWGINLLSHLMLDVCTLLGITKLNTHPKCDGMIKRFNWPLKIMLLKRVSQFGAQWDKHLQEYCGHTATHLMTLPARSPRFCSLDGTAGLPWRLRTSTTCHDSELSWRACSPCLQRRSLPWKASTVHRPSTWPSMIARQGQRSIV